MGGIMGSKNRDKYMEDKYGSSLPIGYGKMIAKYLPLPIRNIVEREIETYTVSEIEVKRLIKQQEGELFVDVGANIGVHSLNAKNNFKRIIAIEPHPLNLWSLKLNIRKAKNIQPYQLAISNFRGSTLLYISHSSGGHTLKQDQFHYSIPVKVTTLSDLLSKENSIELIKVDVEGMEWEVIEGAEAIMHKIKAWIIELHDIEKRKEMNIFMQKLGYTTKWIYSKHRSGLNLHIYANRE